jgi:hypothetical protein
VPHIAKHHSEKEWKSNSGENRRIYLRIARYTVCVGNLLSNIGVAVGIKSRRRLDGLKFLQLGSGEYPSDLGNKSFFL